ncbi:MAG: YicC family protein, partial [Pseudobdellovibrionaceae bacterium]
EPRLHLPREFLPFEPEIKKILTPVFRRGTCDVFVSRKKSSAAGKAYEVKVQKDLAKKYHKAFSDLGKTLGVKTQVSLETIARFPDVLLVEEKSESVEEERKVLLGVCQKAAKACDSEREREGKALQKELAKQLEQLSDLCGQMMKLREEANSHLEDRMRQKLKQKTTGVDFDPQRISQEVLFQLERSDINEELTRLDEHIGAYRNLLKSDEAEGKKLDFYTQELLREVNTIGSKSQLASLTQVMVLAKTTIERLREQVQNVE